MTRRLGSVGRAGVVGVTVGVTLGLAGCGSAPSGAGYARADSGGVAYAEEALGKDEIMSATYSAAMKAKTSHIVMSMSGKASLKAKGDVAYGAKLPKMSMTMRMAQLGKGKLTMRVVGGKVYLHIPAMIPPGKFIAIDPTDRTSPLAKSFAGTADQMDPLKSIKTMESAVRSADRVGKQTMGGVTVEHYKVTVDTSALVKQVGKAAAQQGSLPDTLTYDLWLDERHRLHRMSFKMAGVSFEATMSKWGKPVQVRRPASGDILTLPKA